MPDPRISQLIVLLYSMDKEQQHADESGQREILWYRYRDEIEDVMGLPRGGLNSSEKERA